MVQHLVVYEDGLSIHDTEASWLLIQSVALSPHQYIKTTTLKQAIILPKLKISQFLGFFFFKHAN